METHRPALPLGQVESCMEQNHFEAAKDLFVQGLVVWRQKKVEKALGCLQRAYELNPTDPSIASFLGVVLVRAGIRDRGFQLCRQALKRSPFNEHLLFNLGQAYLFAGKRLEARKTLLLGAKACTNSRRFVDVLLQMGVRRKPVISFLSRNHSINRWLGKLTYRPETVRIEDITN